MTATLSPFHRCFAFLNEILSSELSPECDHVLITNITEKKQQSQEYYCLVLKYDQVIFAKREPYKKDIYRVQFSSQKVTFNNAPLEKSGWIQLVKKIRMVMADIEDRQAKVYETRGIVHGDTAHI